MNYDLDDLVKDYSKFAKKHSLPDFELLNNDFGIEKINKKSLILLKEVRKAVMEDILNTIGFLEMLLNPINASRMYLKVIKTLSPDDIKEVNRIYDEFSKIILDALETEFKGYNEDDEARLIKDAFFAWNKNKESFSKIFASMKSPNSNDFKRDKSYFG